MKESGKENIFYEKIVNSRRYIMTKNRRNWIWAHGPENSTYEQIIKNGSVSYYTSIESMFVNLFETRFREHVTEFTTKNFKKSLRGAFTEVRELGKKLDIVTWDKIKRGDYCKHCNRRKE